MTRYAGLSIDQDTLRIAIFEGSPKKYALIDFIEESIAADSDLERREIVRGILTDLLEQKENRSIDFVTSLDSRQMILREISVPFTRDDQIAKTVRFEAETYLHAFSIDDVIIEYLKCSETEASSRLLICAADKALIESHLETLRPAKIDPATVELDATALATSFANTPIASEDQNVLLVQVDENATRLVFLEQGRVVKIRSVWSRSQGGPSANGTGPGSTAPGPVGGRFGDPAAAGGRLGDTDAPIGGVSGEPSASPQATLPASDRGAPSVQDEIAARFEAIERSLEDLDQDDEPADEVPFVVLTDEDYETLRGPEDEAEPGGAGAGLGDGDDDEEVDLEAIIDGGMPSDGGAGDDSEATAEEPEPEEAVGTATLVATEGDGEDDENTPTQAARVLAQYGSTEPLARLILEIERTFAAYLLQGSIDLVVVTGESAERLDVVQRLKDHFEVDVTSFDLGDSFPIEWSGDVEGLSQRGAVACGLGLRALGHGATTFDLRKDEFRFERRFARLMPALTLLGLLLCALSLVWASREHLQLRSLKSENVVLRHKQDQITQAFFGEPVTKAEGANYLAATRKKLQEIKGQRRSRGGAQIKSYHSAMKMFADVMTAIDKVKPTVYPKFTSFDLKPLLVNSSKSSIKFEVESIDEYNRIIQGLKQHCQYVDVFKPSTSELRDGGYEVTVEFKFKDSLFSVGSK